MTVGAVDEYDYRDPGQAIPFDGVPDGTYWFRAMTDPNNDFVEADESNNETDVKVTIANGEVTPGQVPHPDTTPPPIALTAPADGARVSGSVALSARRRRPGAGGAVPGRRHAVGRPRHRRAPTPSTGTRRPWSTASTGSPRGRPTRRAGRTPRRPSRHRRQRGAAALPGPLAIDGSQSRTGAAR